MRPTFSERQLRDAELKIISSTKVPKRIANTIIARGPHGVDNFFTGYFSCNGKPLYPQQLP
jgi:hypothetical protein